jgi:hypothetical protein
MKNILTALVALTVSATAIASNKHSEKCPANCDKVHAFAASVAPVAPSTMVRAHLVSEAAAENLSTLNYTLGVQSTLLKLEEEKLREALADLIAMQAYNKLMHGTLTRFTEEKKADMLEDIAAEERYEKLMATMFGK